VIDDNLVYTTAVNHIEQPVPGDVGALGDYQDHYYLVRAADARENESDD
jgi:hypothetical protein